MTNRVNKRAIAVSARATAAAGSFARAKCFSDTLIQGGYDEAQKESVDCHRYYLPFPFDRKFFDGTANVSFEWLYGEWTFFFTHTTRKSLWLRECVYDTLRKSLCPEELYEAFETLLASFLRERFPLALEEIFPQEKECAITGFGNGVRGLLADEDCNCRHSSLFAKDDGSHPLMYLRTHDFHRGYRNVERIVNIIYSMLSGGCNMRAGICKDRAESLRKEYCWYLDKVYELAAAYAICNQPLYEEVGSIIVPKSLEKRKIHSTTLNVILFFDYLVEDYEKAYEWLNERKNGICRDLYYDKPPCKRCEEESPF